MSTRGVFLTVVPARAEALTRVPFVWADTQIVTAAKGRTWKCVPSVSLPLPSNAGGEKVNDPLCFKVGKGDDSRRRTGCVAACR